MLVIVTAVSWLIYDSRRNLVLEAERTTGNAAFFLADHATRLFEASDLALLEASNAVKATDWDTISKDQLLWVAAARLERPLSLYRQHLAE